ncbi:hypothetical protein [Methylorubrum thiocyanatum]|uniref:Uncharacterized protein n=1 Tax=Methylorubrum thiocyanatum TaxID=47958 RepID=A0AA40VBW9_9HYPH|nr:hypothetical protein [Methylorubrum thiocyanatum]MBA8912902.1 hypothetical protein [Methylorubrum thiocyanatum]GJE83613.1 hypothetical protein CJNNKLLH_4990 [Methylorubrum thiocyanatum]
MLQRLINFVNDNANAISALGSTTSALSSIAALFVAISAVWLSKRLLDENRILRKAGTEPEVIAYLIPNDRNINVINFAIANVGNGPAFEVRFETDLDPEILKSKECFFRIDIGTVPITALPQGEKILTLFGQGFRILAKPELPPFTVDLSYRNVDGQQFKRKTVLDARQYAYVSRLSDSNEEKIANSLERISRSFDYSVTGNHLKVEVTNRKEREEIESNIIDSFDVDDTRSAEPIATPRRSVTEWVRSRFAS